VDSIEIDRLEIRVRGVSSEVARSAVAGLGNEVLGLLAERPGERAARKVVRMDLGKLESVRDANSSHLRRAIAARVVGSITS
jgi:hypothetical protein